MLSQFGMSQMIGNNENSSLGGVLDKGVGSIFRDPRGEDADNHEKELNLCRSGSAPPTVEGSLSAVGGLFNHGIGGSNNGGGFVNNGFLSEDDFRSDPAYSSYYYTNVNLNPRLPPPLLSREDWRSTQGLQGARSAIGDKRKTNKNNGGATGGSQFQMPPGFNSKKNETDNKDKLMGSVDWGGDELIGLLESKHMNHLGLFKEDVNDQSASSCRYPSRPASRNDVDDPSATSSVEAELAHLRHNFSTFGPVNPISSIQKTSGSLVSGAAVPHSYAAVLGASLSRSSTPDAQLIARAPSPKLTPIGEGRVENSERKIINSPNPFNDVSSQSNEPRDLSASFSALNLSNDLADKVNNLSGIKRDAIVDDQNSYPFNLRGVHNEIRPQVYMNTTEHGLLDMVPATEVNKIMMRESGSKNSSLPDLNVAANGGAGFFSHSQHPGYPNSLVSNYGISGYPTSQISDQVNISNLPPLFENAVAASDLGVLGSRRFGGSNLGSETLDHGFGLMGGPMSGNNFQGHYSDPMYPQYMRNTDYAAAAQATALNDPSINNSYMINSYVDMLHKAYLGDLLSQKKQYVAPLGGNVGPSGPHGYFENPAFGVGLSYPGSPLASPLIPNWASGLGSMVRHGDTNMQFDLGMRNSTGSLFGSWNMDNVDNTFGSSLLEEFKSNKTKCFELSEISGHVVEFSGDQYGSRFIQQKLETASMDEKNMVFCEIFPRALNLMTDVFGNYVIQKLFEHGMAEQRRELAGKLFEHVLSLSLQMYGCRVIQKAIEVVDVDQKIKMIKELDGQVMRCVRDQNGNHVIQKCIECVPEEHIQFIVSTFFDQVVTLSTHPYGCRVIQRVLEHCNDARTLSKVMEEIMVSVSMLAQDQYGNYVVQHVLEHGKPHERSTIIRELAGNIVQMSQQKFASNVVEKCLIFSDPTERQLLVNEMLGTTDENEPLQAMMKDQFANYVVQKVLETCNDQQRELILSRIKVHLTALKKYTYGKHIVARVEKLVAAAERRMGTQYMNMNMNMNPNTV